MTDMIARRTAPNRWDLLADGRKFGELKNTGPGGAGWAFRSADDELQAWVVGCCKPVQRSWHVGRVLRLVRKGYEAYLEDLHKMHEAELAAENAWLRAAEAGDPESWAFEDLEREREAWMQGFDASGPGQDWDCNGPAF